MVFGQVFNDEGTTRAVIIGISDYKNDKIPDLQYAHLDALAFKNFLQSAAGNNLPEENIQVLINDQATTGKIVASLGWLVEASKQGDQVIIYFSGHGDVERISKYQRGYLLTHDSPPSNYLAGAFPLFGLQDIISTLSEAEVQVVMISDACRAGKLAGSDFNGTQATSAIMAKQFANEVKILSCQPEEYSLEGKQWGGGRGCFSYHLLDGLYGMAELNDDLTIDLRELGRYLEDNVTREAAPHSQIPMVVGNKKTPLSIVDASIINNLKAEKKLELTNLASIDSKGIYSLIAGQLDSASQEVYEQFLAAVEAGNLMEPEGASANDYYQIIIETPELKKLHGFVKRNFAATLQDESQSALMDYLYSTEKYFTDYIFTDKKSVKNFAKYLERAAELLGEDHYMYNSLKSRQLFFQCYTIFENKDSLSTDSTNQLAIATLQEALQYDAEAAYIYKGLGDVYWPWDTTNWIINYEKAIEFAPEWAFLYSDLAVRYRNIANFDKAIYYANKTLETDSSFMMVHQWLAYIYASNRQWVKQKQIVEETIEILEEYLLTTPEDAVFPYYYYQLGEAYWIIGRNPKRAENLLRIAIKLAGDKLPRTHAVLGSLLARDAKRLEESEEELLLAIELDKYNKSEPLAYLADLYQYKMKDYNKAEALYLSSIEELDTNEKALIASHFNDLGELYLHRIKNFEKAEAAFFKALDNISNDPKAHLNLARLYQQQSKINKTIDYFKRAIELAERPTAIQLELLSFALENDLKEEVKLTIDSMDGSKLTSLPSFYYLSKAHLVLEDFSSFESSIQQGISKFPKDQTLLYNNACLYSLSNQPNKAIAQLKLALENGFADFEHLKQDTDLDNIRDLEAFKNLLKEYDKK